MLRAIANKFKFSLPPLPAQPPAHRLSRATLLQLGALILIAMLAHFFIAAQIVAIYALFICLLKLSLVFFRRQTPPKLLMMAMTLLSFGMVLVVYGGWNGQRAGISFIALLLSLKYLESHTLRDYYLVCLILYFLAACSFLFSASILNIVTVLLFTLAVTAVMVRITNPEPTKLRHGFSQASGIIAKAIPLAIILFVFFPRIQGSFGFLPSQENLREKSQLSNSMVAGDFAAGAFNNSLAFRVRFDGAIPSNENLYWRTKVMPYEDNFSWHIAPPNLRNMTAAEDMHQRANLSLGRYNYEILHEKSTDIFLPFLDYVVGYSQGRVLDDYSVYLRERKIKDFSYRGSSTLRPSLANNGIDLGPLLRTSSQPSARILALLDEWRSQTDNPVMLVNLVFQHFRTSGYRYSLMPPPLGNNPVDDFLFETRTGYCEHFASVFTTLMRWLGVPSRVVVGYQGGEFNPIGGYHEIRYSDAHAWSEVLIDNEWTRVDPTAAISPDRIDFGMQALLELWDGNSLMSGNPGRQLADFLNPGGIRRMGRFAMDSWNNLSYQWNKWIVNYDYDKQMALLRSLGLDTRYSAYTLVSILFAGCFILVLIYALRSAPKPAKLAEAQRLYLKFVGRFKRYKLQKNPADTPNQFAHKAKLQFPQYAGEIDAITGHYVALRYSRTPGSLDTFKQMVKQFK
ncbi:MAG: DUF3488 and transglutaminase-like domain-containing protein, partial [Arenicella sp.]|nr:DUF3488 and transglutaminase-like domain-containing protein [Arenicella sp.]